MEVLSTQACGVLTLALPDEQHIVWFRIETTHAMDWAGDPSTKAVAMAGGDGRLSPRTALARWREVVELRSDASRQRRPPRPFPHHQRQLILMSDGLIERRTENLELGLERLATALGRLKPHRRDAADIFTAVAEPGADNDATVLAVHRTW